MIYPVPPVTYGGTERVVADLALAQAQLGHRVTVFAACDSELPGVELVGDYRSLSATGAACPDLPPGFAAQLQAEQLADLVRYAKDFDAIHLHGSAHASGICAALSVPTFRTIHWRADEADHIRHFDRFAQERVIAISHRQARDVPERNLAGVVHHGLPLERYALVRQRREYLAFIGRMTDQKRPDRAIELAQAAGLPLQLAGPVDPGNPAYFDAVVRPRLNDRIRHVGSLTDAQKQTFFSGAVALVFPIDWPEPFGLVMIEAMACGVPVIAWDKGSVREIIEDGVTGIIVDCAEEALERLDEVRRLDPAAIRRVFERRFGVETMARKVVGLYREHLAQRSSNPSSARSPSP